MKRRNKIKNKKGEEGNFFFFFILSLTFVFFGRGWQEIRREVKFVIFCVDRTPMKTVQRGKKLRGKRRLYPAIAVAKGRVLMKKINKELTRLKHWIVFHF